MRPTVTALAGALALAATLTLSAGCADADPQAPGGDASPDAAGADTVLPGDDLPPIDVPPPVVDQGATPGPGGVLPMDDRGLPAADADVPTRFRGRFAADAAACGAAGHVSRLQIDAGTIAFHESSGPVTGVASSPSDIAITAELTGEGETREATYRFRLSDDGEMLTDLGSGMERMRCE